MPSVDFSDVDDALDFSPLPPGPYLCRLTAIDDSERTGAGDEMWALRFTVDEGEHEGHYIYDRISFGHKALPRVKLLCSRMGIDISGPLNLTPDLLMGRRVWVTVDIEEYDDQKSKTRRERNKVPFAGFMEAKEESGDDLPDLRF